MLSAAAHQQQQQRSPYQFEQILEMFIRALIELCTVLCLPLEYALRPRFGTRYFNPITVFGTCVLLVAAASLSVLASSRLPSVGLGLVYFLFLLGTMIHGLRCRWLMGHPEREENSYWEGPALPFFRLLPHGQSWIFVRVLYEPGLCLLAACVLRTLGITDAHTTLYLAAASFALCIKEMLVWYMGWQMVRNILDAQSMGRALNAVMNGLWQGGSDPQSAQALVGLPDNLNPAMRQSVARAMMPTGLPELETLRSSVAAPDAGPAASSQAGIEALRSAPDLRPNGHAALS